MAQFGHHGCTIIREPVPVQLEEPDEREITGWEFTALDPKGQAIPVNVTALDRHIGLEETKKRVENYLASITAETAFDAAQMN